MSNSQLKSIVERIERLHEEREALADDVKEVYAEAKSNGFDPKVIRAVIKIRKADPNDASEFDALVQAYLAEVGVKK